MTAKRAPVNCLNQTTHCSGFWFSYIHKWTHGRSMRTKPKVNFLTSTLEEWEQCISNASIAFNCTWLMIAKTTLSANTWFHNMRASENTGPIVRVQYNQSAVKKYNATTWPNQSKRNARLRPCALVQWQCLALKPVVSSWMVGEQQSEWKRRCHFSLPEELPAHT